MDFIKEHIKRPTYTWQEFATDLQNYLIIRAIAVIVALFFGIAFGIGVHNAKLIIFYYVVVLLCAVWLVYVFLMAAYDKIYVYEGVCEKTKLNKVSINTSLFRKSKFDIYGKCNAIMVIRRENRDGSISEAKFIVPIGYNYELEEGNVMKIYTFENGVFPKNENTFIISNPLITKVAKM